MAFIAALAAVIHLLIQGRDKQVFLFDPFLQTG